MVFGLVAGGVEEVQFFGTVLMETPTHLISISLGRHHRREGSSSYDQNDKIQGKEASEPCLAGRKEKKLKD
uniref:Uncharacterized protein n=1 Tax=Brassica campestris TaxID=3711 RepID=M4EVW3_BRACM